MANSIFYFIIILLAIFPLMQQMPISAKDHNGERMPRLKAENQNKNSWENFIQRELGYKKNLVNSNLLKSTFFIICN